MLDNSTDLDPFLDKLTGARNIYLIACGTSYHAGLLGSVYFNQFAGRAAIPVLAPQFSAQYGSSVGPEDVGIFISQSGETKDVLNAIKTAEERGMGILGLVNVVGSTLTLVSEVYLPLTCGYEISVPATKTYSNQVLTLLYLALRYGGHDTDALNAIPEMMDRTLEEVSGQIDPAVNKLAGWDDLYILGYGLTYPVALEGALKLKEITYTHCEGMLSTEFKHGPLSAVSEGYPVIFTVGPDDIPLIVSGINEVTCRGGSIWVRTGASSWIRWRRPCGAITRPRSACCESSSSGIPLARPPTTSSDSLPCGSTGRRRRSTPVSVAPGATARPRMHASI